jgi:RES domain-containing protein
MRVWRLVKSKHALSAFDGEGARRYGGRWNSVGTIATYASDSAALAVLEVLVHLEDIRVLPAYSLVSAVIPDELIEDLDPASLPRDWNAFPVAPPIQAIGDAWLRSARALGLRVPSAVVTPGVNVLINPAHVAFARMVVDPPTPFRFDDRLLG